jgi:hypothetical protein
MDIKSNDDLLNYLTERFEAGEKQWFGRMQQRLTGVKLAHEIAARHADTMTPEQVAQYVVDLNNQIFKKIVIG